MSCESEHLTYVQEARALIGKLEAPPTRIGFWAKAAGVACFMALVGGVAMLFKGGPVKGDVRGEMGFALVGHNTGEAEAQCLAIESRVRRLILTWERPLRMNF